MPPHGNDVHSVFILIHDRVRFSALLGDARVDETQEGDHAPLEVSALLRFVAEEVHAMQQALVAAEHKKGRANPGSRGVRCGVLLLRSGQRNILAVEPAACRHALPHRGLQQPGVSIGMCRRRRPRLAAHGLHRKRAAHAVVVWAHRWRPALCHIIAR